MAPNIITLTTDFGYRDPFVGIMKGVILGINPTAKLIDLSHGVEPQDVVAGALSLAAAVRYFQPGTVHMAVVDPGVGSQRKSIAIETEDAFYVGPDNGVLSFAVESSRVIHIVELSNADYYLKPTSTTFHGRDIFSPAAAHIAMGTPAGELGNPMDTFMTLEWPAVEHRGCTLTGAVVYVDHFGNLISNIRAADLDSGSGKLAVTIRDTTINGLSSSYRAAGAGNYLAIINSWGLLEISRCSGNARVGLGADVGSIVKITGLDV